MTDLPTPNTETGHTPEIQRSSGRTVELAEESLRLHADRDFPYRFADIGDHLGAVVVFGTSSEEADARLDQIITSVNACASIPGDPGEGIRKAIEALEQIIEMNRMTAKHQYGEADKAECWSCVRVARAALSALKGES